MKILIVLAHPDPSSFNAAIAKAAADALREAGHEVVFHDLYREGFDPVLLAGEIPSGADVPSDIRSHCEDLALADGIVVVHPNWWGGPPAILKGWVDRVVRPGVAYKFAEGDGGEGVPVGLLKAKAAVVFNTSNTPEDRERETFGDPTERFWKDCVFALCGVRSFFRRTFGVVVTSTDEQRREWLWEARGMVLRAFPRGPRI